MIHIFHFGPVRFYTKTSCFLPRSDGKENLQEAFLRSTLQHKKQTASIWLSCWWYTASFKCSIIHHSGNLCLWLVNHERQSETVAVCKQTDQTLQASSSLILHVVLTNLERRIGGLFVCFCLIGLDFVSFNWMTTAAQNTP